MATFDSRPSWTCTAARAPTIAKSPCRRATSSTAKPDPAPHTGKRTAVISSSGSREVVKTVSKKSAAGMRRMPFGPATSISASSTRTTAGSSAAGSACAREPPRVPRLRIWKWPMCGATRASNGDACRNLRVALQGGVAGRRAHHEGAVLPPDRGELPDAVDVHQDLGPREPQGQHRHEALAAGQDLRLVAVLREYRQAVLDRLRRVVVERCWFHVGNFLGSGGPAVSRDWTCRGARRGTLNRPCAG